MLKKKISALHALIAAPVIYFMALNAAARTDYIPVERAKDIYIFERYLEIIEKNREPVTSIKSLGLNDKNWKEAAARHANTISAINYSAEGKVILKNDQFNFKIIFTPEYFPTKIKWTCKIEDESIFFHPQNCNLWSKVIKLKEQ